MILLLYVVFLNPVYAEVKFFLLDKADLIYSKQQIEQNNALFVDAKNALITKADGMLKHPLYSVMDKSLVAASGDKHDYFSFPPYWWPDPTKDNGLPYIRKDGVSNPDANNGATDKQRLVRMSNDVYYLALAWYFSDNPIYAEKAVAQLEHWFIDPATKMNPNIQYGQSIPGRNQGRGAGLIDSRVLVNVIDAIEILYSTDQLSKQNYQALQDWYSDFYHWMTSSKNGISEDNVLNNHGTYYDLQAAAFALFTHKNVELNKRLHITQSRRIANHFNQLGQQPAELARTRSWHYSNFNLDAYSKLGRIGELVDVDLWHFTLNGHSLKNGYLYIAQYIDSQKIWPHDDIDPFDENRAMLNMLFAAKAYPEEKIFNIKANYLLAKNPKSIFVLLYPLP